MAPNEPHAGDKTRPPSSVSWLMQAGETLLETDPLAAVEHLSRAYQLVESDGATQPAERLVRLLAQGYVWTNRASEAIALIDGWRLAGAAGAAPESRDQSAALRVLVAQAWAALGDLQKAADLLEGAVREDVADPEWQRAFGEAQILRAMSFRDADALANVDRLLAAVILDPLAEVHARCARSWALKNAGRIDDAIIEARRASDVERPAELRSARSPTVFLADALLAGDRLSEFDEAANAARLEVIHHGDVWQVPALAAMITGAEMRRGNWRRAWSEAEGGIGWATETGNRLTLPWLFGLQSAIASWRGHTDHAEQLLHSAEIEMAATPQSGLEVLLWARAVQASMTKPAAVAHERFTAIWDLAIGFRLTVRLPMLGPDVVRFALLAGDRAAALDAALVLDRLEASIAGLDPCRTLVRGLLEDDPETLTIAADGYLRLGLRFDAARALADGAVAARRRQGSAAALSTRAQALFAEIGANGLRQELERVVPVTATVSGSVLDGLSPAERRVAALVATGVSNSAVATELSISRRTVESHLARIFDKLGLATRVELALLVAAEQP